MSRSIVPAPRALSSCSAKPGLASPAAHVAPTLSASVYFAFAPPKSPALASVLPSVMSFWAEAFFASVGPAGGVTGVVGADASPGIVPGGFGWPAVPPGFAGWVAFAAVFVPVVGRTPAALGAVAGGRVAANGG